MSRIPIELESDLAKATWLARQPGISVEQFLDGLIDQACPPVESNRDLALGLFRDEPDLMEPSRGRRCALAGRAVVAPLDG
jgi:hypothetical protein